MYIQLLYIMLYLYCNDRYCVLPHRRTMTLRKRMSDIVSYNISIAGWDVFIVTSRIDWLSTVTLRYLLPTFPLSNFTLKQRGKNGAIISQLSLNCCRWKAYPIRSCCNVANFNIFFTKKVKVQVQQKLCIWLPYPSL